MEVGGGVQLQNPQSPPPSGSAHDNQFKKRTKRFLHRVIPKDAAVNANSEDPYQTATLGAVRLLL